LSDLKLHRLNSKDPFRLAGAFLGRCEVSARDLLHPPSEGLTLRLEPKPGLSDKQLKLVGGTLSLQPSPLPVGQGRAPPPRHLLHALGKSGAGEGP